MAKDKLVTSGYCLILAANFLLYFAFYLILPVLPFYLTEVFHTGNAAVGVILSCYTIASLCIRPFSGYLLDTLARKPLYLVAYFIFITIFAGYMLAGVLSLFIMLRVVHGLAFGMVTVAGNTIVIDITPSSRRGEAVGYYGLMNNPPSNLLVSTGFTVVRDKAGVGGPFIYLALTRPSITEMLQSVAEQSTSAYPSIKSSDLGQIEIPEPTKEELGKIKPQLDNLFELIAQNERESRALRELRDALLPKLMSGEIDVSQIGLPTQPNSHLSSFSIRSCCVRSFGRHRAFLLRGGSSDFLCTGPVISRCGCDGRQSEHPCKEHGEREGKCPLSRHAGLCPAMGRLLLCAVLVRHDASIPSDFERQKFP